MSYTAFLASVIVLGIILCAPFWITRRLQPRKRLIVRGVAAAGILLILFLVVRHLFTA